MRQQEIMDSLVDLLIQITHKIKTNAETKIVNEFAGEVFKVEGKNNILYQMAKIALDNPTGTFQDILYPLVGKQILQDIVKELGGNKPNHREHVYAVIRSSYSHHYRRMLPAILDALELYSNTKENSNILKGIAILRKYIDSSLINYPDEENIPVDNIIPELWNDLVIESSTDGSAKINRVNYEIAILHTLRERIRCKAIWVKNAYRYRNPDKDLPIDFEDRRSEYYTTLNKPQDKYEFTNDLKQQMKESLAMLNSNIPNNKKVKIQNIRKRKKNKKGWICVSPLKPQPEPQNIGDLKAEIFEHWAATNLLDILKETEFQVDFTSCFKTIASKEILGRSTIQERLLLCLFGVATNIGIKRIRSGNKKVSYNDLRYIYRRFITPENTREAITKIVNAIFQARDPSIWGEATSTCISDAKKFSAWDQNLMTEWHVRYRGAGIMVYWHIDKNSACIYSQLKSCSSSEVASMIEGVLRHCTDMEVKKQYTDSRGQSVIGFAFSHLLNFELMPRLSNIGSQKLNLPEPLQKDEYNFLQPILTKPINWDLIHAQYDLIVKYATALRLGTADSEIILRRFTRNNTKHPVYKALMELGKAVKTIFLCKYLSSEALRQEIHEGLNVVERWNSVNGFISYAKKGVISTNRPRDQEISLLCLHLLQISMVYINTIMIQQILKQSKWQDRLTVEDKRALSPLVHIHINPYGIFNLDLTTRLKLEI
jgi:TnpA family transposase